MLCTLFNIQVLVIVAESSGHVHTFASDRAQSLILSDDARQLLTNAFDQCWFEPAAEAEQCATTAAGLVPECVA